MVLILLLYLSNNLRHTYYLLDYPKRLTCLLQNLYAGQEAMIRTRHGTMDLFKIGKEYIKAIYCHFAYLTYMQSTS